MANNDKTQDTVPTAAEEITEEPKKEAVEEGLPKPTGFIGRITYPFRWVIFTIKRIFRRIGTALSNTARRIEDMLAFFWRIFKKLVIIAVVLALITGGFFLGIYLRLFDLEDLNRTFQLYRWPVIGENFVKPAEPEAAPEPEQGKKDEDKKDTGKKPATVVDVRPNPDGAKGKAPARKLTKADIEKQMKAEAAAEKKRVSKLARLYEGMKPQEAADIIDELEDRLAVAILQKMDESQASKILAKLEPEKAARLSRVIFQGSTGAPRRNPSAN